MELAASGKNSKTGIMIRVVCLLLFTPLVLASAQDWQAALARMPLNTRVPELNRTNCVELMLAAFQEDPKVKAFVFMPGATDEFYMFRRAKARLITTSSPSLLDAVSALTNQTLIRATFRPPVLMLHTDEDPLDVVMKIEHEATAKKLQTKSFGRHLICNDRDWNYVQPLVKKKFGVDVRPWRHSYDSWHFYRHSFAAWNLEGLEALQTIALAGKTSFTVQKRRLIFKGDDRVRATPKLDAFPK
jgi:hypothetical protein